jgi:hypothetical protein
LAEQCFQQQASLARASLGAYASLLSDSGPEVKIGLSMTTARRTRVGPEEERQCASPSPERSGNVLPSPERRGEAANSISIDSFRAQPAGEDGAAAIYAEEDSVIVKSEEGSGEEAEVIVSPRKCEH